MRSVISAPSNVVGEVAGLRSGIEVIYRRCTVKDGTERTSYCLDASSSLQLKLSSLQDALFRQYLNDAFYGMLVGQAEKGHGRACEGAVETCLPVREQAQDFVWDSRRSSRNAINVSREERVIFRFGKECLAGARKMIVDGKFIGPRSQWPSESSSSEPSPKFNNFQHPRLGERRRVHERLLEFVDSHFVWLD